MADPGDSATPGSAGRVPQSPVASLPGAQPVNRPAPPSTSPGDPDCPVPEKPRTRSAAAACATAARRNLPRCHRRLQGHRSRRGHATASVTPRDPLTPPARRPPGRRRGADHPHRARHDVPGRGRPYTVPVSINNARASRSCPCHTSTQRAAVRNVQDGTSCGRAARRPASLPNRRRGRVDIAIARSGDQIGARGRLLARSCSMRSAWQRRRVASVPARPTARGQPAFSPVTVTVR